MRDFHFRVDGESTFFEKASAPEGRRRRIAGVISTETRDRQNEIVIQKGLNFDHFVTHGWFNDNHSKDTDAVIGWPESIQTFQKGQKLPNGELAKSNCTWCEGYLLEGSERADKIWGLSQALAKSGGARALGFSIEGNVTKRMGPARKIVAEAVVTNTAVTNCPVNTDTRLETLAKSLHVIANLPDDFDRLEAIEKALTAGHGVPSGPAQGEGAGSILSPEDLEKDENGKPKLKRLAKSDAVALLQRRLPNVSPANILRIVNAAIALESAERARS